MAQSKVIVTYAPAQRTVARAPVPAAGKRTSRRIGVTLAGALLAGGAAFTLGTFVRPDGSIREPGNATQQQPRIALPEPASTAARALPAPPADAAAPRRVSAASPLPYLALVRDAAPSSIPQPAPSPPGAARRMLTAPVARENIREVPNEPGRVALRAAHGPAPIAIPVPDLATAPAPTTDSGVALAASPAAPPAPVPATGQRRDLAGFLSEQGLVLAAETDSEGPLAQVSEWTPDDFAAPDDEPPSSVAPAAPGRLAAIAGAALAQGELGVGSEPALVQPAVDGLAAEASQVPQLAEAEAPVETTPVARDLPTSAGPVFVDPARTTDAEANTHAHDAASRLAVASVAPVQGLAAVAAMPQATYDQSYPVVVVNGEALGAVTLRDLGPQGSAIHLGALVGLLKLRMPQAQFARLSSAAAADRFVTFDELRDAGIIVQLDAGRDRLLIEAR